MNTCCLFINLWRTPLGIKKALSRLATIAGFVTALSSISVAQQFQEVTTEAGLISEAKKSWGNPIWGDINNDGLLDLIVPTLSSEPFVYLNNGDGTFTDIRATSGIERAPSFDNGTWRGFAFGDYDGDGNLDLYIAELGDGTALKRDLLFKGHGDGTFENVTVAAGIETSNALGNSAFWFDYDNDGKLDLFVKNYASANRLYKNNGNGTFTQVPGAAGLATATQGGFHGTISSFADYDNDGLMDVAFSVETAAFYRNQGGTFVDASESAGVAPVPHSKGIAWGDYNNDGLLDLYLARGQASGQNPLADDLYRNNGDGTFTDVAAVAGVDTTTNTWAAVWGDYDNDGFLDLFVARPGRGAIGVGNANLLYHNNGNGTFTDVAAAEGVALQDDLPTSAHKVAAWVDYNNDGFLDLLIKDGIGDEGDNGPETIGFHRLFKNNGNSNHFIKVNLVGQQSNRGGIGARVTVTSTAGMSFRQNNGGGGGEEASQGSEPLHFGIGTATEATVEVIWPSGIVDIVSSVAANSTLTIVEGSSSSSLTLVSAASRLTHGTAGTFDVNMPLTGTSGVEDRSASTYNAVFTFNATVTSGEVSLVSGTATVGSISFNGNSMTAQLTGVTAAETVVLRVENINGDGEPHGDVSFGFLTGDADADRTVARADKTAVQAQLNQPVTSANFRDDLNATGRITNGDVQIVKANRGHVLP